MDSVYREVPGQNLTEGIEESNSTFSVHFMPELLPLFVNLAGRRVLLVGAGRVGASKLASLLAAGADVTVVAPDIHGDVERAEKEGTIKVSRRRFVDEDVSGVWLVVAAATPDVNQDVALAADARAVFVNAVDDPPNATAYLSGVVRRDGVTLAISTRGDAPGLAGLLREALDEVLPADLRMWMDEAKRQRLIWKRDNVPMPDRRPLLLEALNRLYEERLRPR